MSEESLGKFGDLSPKQRALLIRRLQNKRAANLSLDQRVVSFPGNKEQYRLANNLAIHHHSKLQTEALYKEIFEQNVYLDHGVVLHERACVFDVGANIGMFTLFIKEKWENSVIYAFEPIPPNFEILQANVALHHLDVKLFNYGLSDKHEMATFTYYPLMAAFSGLYPEGDKELSRSLATKWLQNNATFNISPEQIDKLLEEYFQFNSYICQLRTLSEVLQEHQIECIDLLKVDVEKSELKLLLGIEDEHWRKIKQIVMEVHTKELLEDIIPLLTKNNYDCVIEDKKAIDNSIHYAYMLYCIKHA